jgi:hypothetical protein
MFHSFNEVFKNKNNNKYVWLISGLHKINNPYRCFKIDFNKHISEIQNRKISYILRSYSVSIAKKIYEEEGIKINEAIEKAKIYIIYAEKYYKKEAQGQKIGAGFNYTIIFGNQKITFCGYMVMKLINYCRYSMEKQKYTLNI